MMNQEQNPETFEHVVFLGLHNADRFQNKLSSWLPKLDLSGVKLFAVDNFSSDSTSEWAPALIQTLEGPHLFMSNKINLGGYGSLIQNLENIGNPTWITTLHQDDIYAANHIQNHKLKIRSAKSDLGMICTEAVSNGPNNSRIAFPRGNWFLDSKLDPIDVFLAHLRNHVFPFSGATFRTEVLRRYSVPWHSTAFPDTELVMKMSGQYSFEFSEGEPVTYLENPTSESHILDNYQRDFGSFQALIRVFSHNSFELICKRVKDSDLDDFLRSVREGIEIRISDPILRNSLVQFAIERSSEILGLNQTLAKHLIPGYLSVGDVSAVELLSRLSGSSFQAADLVLAGTKLRSPSLSLQIGRVVALLIPKSLHKKFYMLLLTTKIAKKFFPQWDFDWHTKH